MNFSKIARTLDKAAVIARDLNAIKRGRIGQRLVNRAMGKALGKATNGIWR